MDSVPDQPDHLAEDVFKKLGQSHGPALLYRMVPELSEVWLRELTDPVLRDAALPFLTLHAARFCVREWGRCYRTRLGPDLAEHIRSTFSRYQDLGVSPEILARLLVAIDKAVGPHSEDGDALD